MSHAFLVPTPSAPHVAHAAHAYLASAHSRIDRVIGAASLAEPRFADLDRAARLVTPLVETLAALAMGTIVGGVARAVRRALGDEVTARVATMLARHVATYAPRPVSVLAILDESPARSFSGELARRLRQRIASIAPDTRALLLSIADIVAAGTPEDVHAFERVLAASATDSLLDDKYARDLARGWAAWIAVAGGPPVAEPTPLWRLWMQRARGEREVLTPSPVEIVAAGFIARIG